MGMVISFSCQENGMKNVRVAQLDRASGYGPEGRGFESFHARFYESDSDESLFLFSYIYFFGGWKCLRKEEEAF